MPKKPWLVFLDAGTVDYGDVSLAPISKLGHLKFFSASSPGEILSRATGADAVITNKCVFHRKILQALPRLQVIHVAATGVNNIDLETARERGVAVTNVRGYSTESVVQFTLGFILNLASGMLDLNRAAHDGTWSRSIFPMLAPTRISEVSGKVLGIIGYGSIGRRVGQIAEALGMKILAARIPGRLYPKKDFSQRVSLEQLLKTSDFITIHAPLSPLTQGLMDREKIKKMKKTAYLINMARGGIVDEMALAEALRKGSLRGAALDVLAQEPPRKDCPLLRAPNLLITPHVAWASVEARRRLVSEIAENIKAFQQGKKRNRIV